MKPSSLVCIPLCVLGLGLSACGGDSPDDPAAVSGDDTAHAGESAAGQSAAGKPSADSPAAGASAAGKPAAGSGGAGTGGAGSSAAGKPAAGSGGADSPAAGGGGEGGAGTSGRSGAGAGGSQAGSNGAGNSEHFSFFVASWTALQRVSKSPNGFGGDLRYGEKDGLSGADKICREIAETAMPGAGKKTWRAFLSVTKGPDGNPVHALDRVGTGPWYDRQGRLIAQNKAALGMQRPQGADPAIINDLPNEDGVPNHAPDGMQVDNHDILTGTNETGQLFSTDWKFTCHDWTSAVGGDGTPRVGHSWPRGGGGGSGRMGGMGGGSGANWMSALNEAGCAPGASLVEMGGPKADNPTVGSGGGYGGIYCFALEP